MPHMALVRGLLGLRDTLLKSNKQRIHELTQKAIQEDERIIPAAIERRTAETHLYYSLLQLQKALRGQNGSSAKVRPVTKSR